MSKSETTIGVIGVVSSNPATAPALTSLLDTAYTVKLLEPPTVTGDYQAAADDLTQQILAAHPCLLIFTPDGPFGTGFAIRRGLNRASDEVAAIPALYLATDDKPPRTQPANEPTVFHGWVPATVKRTALLRIVERLSGVAPALPAEGPLPPVTASLFPESRVTAPAPSAATPGATDDSAPEPVPLRSAQVRGWTRRACTRCRQWSPRDEDRYCAGCGSALQLLTLDQSEIVLALHSEETDSRAPDAAPAWTRISATGRFRLTNAGSNTVTFSIQSRGIPGLKATVSSGTLTAGETVEIKLRVPARPIERGHTQSGTLQIASPGAGSLEIRLVLPSPPWARLEGPVRVSLVHPEESSFELTLSNQGGGLLVTRAIKADASVQVPPLPDPLEGGARHPLRFSIDTAKLSAGIHELPLHLEFEDHPPIDLRINCELVKPALLRLTPPSIHRGQLAPGRSGTDVIDIFNPGQQLLQIDRVESTVPWMTAQLTTPNTGSQRSSLKIRWTAPPQPGMARGAIVIHSNAHRQPITTVPVEIEAADLRRYPYPAGFDFGTSASCVAWIDENGMPALLRTDQGEPLIPSLLFIDFDGEIKVGDAAQLRALFAPSRAIQAIKRIVGQQKNVRMGESMTPATDLVAALLRHLRNQAEDELKRTGQLYTLERAILTVPAELPDGQLQLAAEAARQAGLDIDTIQPCFIDEPTAAALYYAWKIRLGPEAEWPKGDENILVFDFGGGTLDCAVVRILTEPSWAIEVLSTSSNHLLGGEDVDRALVAVLVNKVKEQHPGFDPGTILLPLDQITATANASRSEALLESRWNFKTEAERAKIAFSTTQPSTVSVKLSPILQTDGSPIGKEPVVIKLTDKEFDSVLNELMGSVHQVVDQALAVAGLAASDITTVLHTGRTSGIPRVRKEVNQRLPRATDASRYISIKTCVALGACLWGYFQISGDQPIQLKRLDRMPVSVGYRTTVGLRREFRPIFARGCSFPGTARVTLPVRGGHKVLELFEQNEHSERRLGLVQLHCDPAVTETTLDFRLDEDRQLHLSHEGRPLTIDTTAEKNSDAFVSS